MIRLLDKMARKDTIEIANLLISPPPVEDNELGGVNPTVLISENANAFDRIDAKAGSVLTHISMMLAAARFMISAAVTSDLERIVIGIEIICYLFIALICIRCLGFVDIPGPQHGGLGQVNSKLRIEVRRRSLLLNIAIRWMFLITFIFMLYRFYFKTRKFSWVMTRKLSETLSRNFVHSCGMVLRMNARMALANCFWLG